MSTLEVPTPEVPTLEGPTLELPTLDLPAPEVPGPESRPHDRPKPVKKKKKKTRHVSAERDEPSQVIENAILIDPDGDLMLRVGEHHILPTERVPVFRVCSSALRRSSKVWKIMLFGPWKEAKPENREWLVEFPNDRPDVLRILLDIIHGNFEKVPSTLPLSDLSHTLEIAEIYDLARCIRPWANSWVKPLRTHLTDPTHRKSTSQPSPSEDPETVGWTDQCGLAHMQKASSAWILGCENVFALEFRSFIFNSKLSGPDAEEDWERGTLVTSCGDSVPITTANGIIPDDFEGMIITIPLKRLF